MGPDLSIVIVTYNSSGCIGDCLESIARTAGDLGTEVFVVDNASHDETLRIVEQTDPGATIIRNRTNAGFPRANNQAIALARGRYVLLLNPDTVVRPGALQQMVEFMDHHPECGACGPVLEDVSGRVAEDLRRPSFFLYLVHVLGGRRLLRRHLRDERREIVSGACLMVRREVVAEVGVLDVGLFWCEDVDFCVRIGSAGHRVMRVPNAVVMHLEGDSARSNLSLVLERQYTSKIMFLRKHASGLETRLTIVVFLAQLSARALKWTVLAVLAPSPEARTRATACAYLLRELPRYLRTGYPRESGVR